MPKQKINSHTYKLFYRGHAILVRIKRDGKALMARALDLDFTQGGAIHA